MPYVHNRRVHGRLYELNLEKGNGRIGKLTLAVARLVNDEENSCRFKIEREETGCTHDLHGWLIAVRERLLELFCDASICSDIRCDTGSLR